MSKIRITQALFTAVAGSIVLACSPSENPAAQVTQDSTEIPFKWMGPLRAVENDLDERVQSDPDCYLLLIEAVDDNLIVRLLPEMKPGDEDVRGGGTSCGREVQYEVDLEGKILSRSYFR
jgi:hypothetical protein